MQDEITRSVAAAIEPRLLVAEGIRALARSPEHLGAWDLVAQAQTHFWRLTRADYEAAVKPLQQAVNSHPDYAPGHGRLGFCLVFAAHMGWISSSQGMLSGREHAIRATHHTTAALCLRPGFKVPSGCAAPASPRPAELRKRGLLDDGSPRTGRPVDRLGPRQRSLSNQSADGTLRRRSPHGRAPLVDSSRRTVTTVKTRPCAPISASPFEDKLSQCTLCDLTDAER